MAEILEAPDLEEIIGGSDSGESADAIEEILSPEEVLNRLKTLWQNELASPELLPVRIELINLVMDELSELEKKLKAHTTSNVTPGTDVVMVIQKMLASRIRYILTDYHRIRLKKIEKYYCYVVHEERERDESKSAKLTMSEFQYAADLYSSVRNHLNSTVLKKLPQNMQSFTDKQLMIQPDLNTYVFIKVIKQVDAVEVVERKPDVSTSVTYVTLLPDEIHLLPYNSIKQSVYNGSVLLL